MGFVVNLATENHTKNLLNEGSYVRTIHGNFLSGMRANGHAYNSGNCCVFVC